MDNSVASDETIIAQESQKPLRILRLVNTFGETSPAYKQFSAPMMDQQEISVCSYFSAPVDVPPQIRFYDGENSILGFLKIFIKALQNNEYDVIHSHYSHVGVMSLIVLLFRYPWLLKRTVYTVHTSYPNLKLRNRIQTIITFIFYRHIVFCGHSSAQSFPPIYHRFLGSRAHVIQNGVDVKQVDQILSDTECNRSDEFNIISIGRLIPLKNTKTLLRAIAKLNDETVKLTLVGDGAERHTLQQLTEELGISHQVIFTGLIPRNDVYKKLCETQLFVSVSFIEGLPIATLEAMSARCMVILSDIDPHKEIALDSESLSIPLVTSDDSDELATEIKNLKNLSSEQQSEIGEKNRDIVVTHFTVERMLAEYEALFQSIVL